MPITKVLTNTSLDSATGGNLTVTLPTGLLPSDVGVLTVGGGRSSTGNAGSYDIPAGWLKVGEVINATDGTNHITVQTYLTVGTPSGLIFTLSGALETKGYVCVAYRGVDNVNPIDARGIVNSNAGANSLTTNLVTVATEQALHLIGFGDYLGRTLSATGFTVAVNGEVNESAAVLYNLTPKSIGSTGTVAVAASGTGTGQILAAVPFALRPAVETMESHGAITRLDIARPVAGGWM